MSDCQGYGGTSRAKEVQEGFCAINKKLWGIWLKSQWLCGILVLLRRDGYQVEKGKCFKAGQGRKRLGGERRAYHV